MTRKLIEAQEQERSRIGRELHDDINQRLAMLAIGLEQLRNDPLNVRSRLRELWEETTAISSEVQALSHELHSSKLEYLGFVSYMKSWCSSASGRKYRLTSEVICLVLCHSRSASLSSECYRKPSTTPSSIVERKRSKSK